VHLTEELLDLSILPQNRLLANDTDVDTVDVVLTVTALGNMA